MFDRNILIRCVLDNIDNGPITDEIIVSVAIIILGPVQQRVAASAASIYKIKSDVLAAYISLSLSFETKRTLVNSSLRSK